MPFPLDRKQQKQSMIDAANAPMPTMNEMGQGMSDMASQAKKAVLQRLMQPQQPPMDQYQRSPQEDLALKMKGQNTIQASKGQEANNVINQTQQEIGDLENMAQFGDPDAQSQLASKKELLRKYLMNNR